MWLKARDTLNRICDLAEQEGVVFTLENLVLGLVSAALALGLSQVGSWVICSTAEEE